MAEGTIAGVKKGVKSASTMDGAFNELEGAAGEIVNLAAEMKHDDPGGHAAAKSR